jgi:hypothetical protein
MDFLVIISVATIVTAGILYLTPDTARWISKTYRLPLERRFGATSVKGTIAKASDIAGKWIAGFRKTKKNELVHREIYSALSVLRNYASAENVTTDYLLESFSSSSGLLREACSGTLRLLRTGRRVEAVEYFSNYIGIPFARDFIMLILDWDAISPGKQKQTIVAFQNALKETRTTELMRKNEVMSDLVYLPVIAGVLVIFVNFIYVAYFAEQNALLSELFY